MLVCCHKARYLSRVWQVGLYLFQTLISCYYPLVQGALAEEIFLQNPIVYSLSAYVSFGEETLCFIIRLNVHDAIIVTYLVRSDVENA